MQVYIKAFMMMCVCIFAMDSVAQISSVKDIHLTQVSYLDFSQNRMIEADILIQDGLIKEIWIDEDHDLPEGVLTIDLAGKYLIPGLIDAHVHLATDPSGSDNLDITKKRLQFLLENGVTTVRDMAGDTRYLNYLSRSALLGEITSPNIYFSALMAGPEFFKDPRTHLTGKGARPGQFPWMRAVDPSTNLQLAIAEAKGSGATGIKIYADLDAVMIKMITYEAHQQGMKTWADATVFPALPSDVLDANIDVISHSTLIAWEGAVEIPKLSSKRYQKQSEFNINDRVYQNLFDQMVHQNVILDATLATFKNDRLDPSIFDQGVALTKQAYRTGVKIGVGTDLSLDNFDRPAPIILEMKTLQKEVGMSTIDLLKSATIINAEMIAKESMIGSIEIGKQADLVVLKADPLADLSNIGRVDFVMKSGTIYRKR